MQKIICKKACFVGGRRYYIGEQIPTSAIDPSRLKKIEEMGLIHIVEEPDPQPEPKPEVKPEPEKKPHEEKPSTNDTKPQAKGRKGERK